MLPEALLEPIKVIVPDVEIPVVASRIPSLVPVAPKGTVPVKAIAPLPVDIVAPSKLIPREVPVLTAEDVPINVIVPVPVSKRAAGQRNSVRVSSAAI